MEQKENYLLIKLNISLFCVKQRNLDTFKFNHSENQFSLHPIQFEMFEVCLCLPWLPGHLLSDEP